jgi:hypothetical protein
VRLIEVRCETCDWGAKEKMVTLRSPSAWLKLRLLLHRWRCGKTPKIELKG